MSKKYSEFGKGLTYNLGLVLMHAFMETANTYSWFIGATDHLQELTVPDSLPITIKKMIEEYKEMCIKIKELGVLDKLDKDYMIDCALLILREIDRHLGVETIKGEWE